MLLLRELLLNLKSIDESGSWELLSRCSLDKDLDPDRGYTSIKC